MPKNKHLWAFAAAALIALVFLGCEGDYERPSHFEKLADLNRPDCRIGVFLGYSDETCARRFFPLAQIVGFEEISSAATELLAGKIEAFVSDEHILNVARRTYPYRLKFLDDVLEEGPAVAALSAKNTNLLARVNDFIAQYKKNGTYENMFLRWCQCDRYVPIPTIDPAPGATEELRIATSGLNEPSSFIDEDGNLTGYDVEFGLRLAKFLGRVPRFVLKPNTDFSAELRRGDVDIVLDDYDDVVPRPGIAYSKGYLDADMRVLVAEDDPAMGAKVSDQMLDDKKIGMSSFLIRDARLRLFVNGFVNTVFLTIFSALLGLLVARGVARGERYLPRWGFNVVDLFFAGIRALPPILIVLIVNASILTFAWPWLTLVVAFGIWFAAYLVRTADNPSEIWLPIVRLRLPVLLQWTAVAGAVNVFDLTMASDLVCGRSVRAFLPLIAVAAAYIFLAWLFDTLLSFAEKQLDFGDAASRRVKKSPTILHLFSLFYFLTLLLPAASAAVPTFAGFEAAHYQQFDRKIEQFTREFNAARGTCAVATAKQAKAIPALSAAEVKAQMIQESGGGDMKSRVAWTHDPLQINVPGDWSEYKRYLGLKKPRHRNEGSYDKNVRAALRYLVRKGFGVSGQPASNRPDATFDGWAKALERYNGRTDKTKDGKIYSQAYSERIRRRAANPSILTPISL